MIKSVLIFFLAGVLPVISPWKEGDLDIHLMATGRGENTFVVMPDGTTMLIDTGDNVRCKCLLKDKGPMEIVTSYIRHFSPRKDTLDYFYFTHFHDDHADGASGIGENFKIGRIVDRCYPDYENVKVSLAKYRQWLEKQTGEGGTPAEKFVVGSHDQFSPRSGKVKGFDIFNVAGGGYISTGTGLHTRPMTADNPADFDENMNSCAILMRYGPFTYYTGGDIPGCNWYVKKFRNGKAVSEVRQSNPKIKYRNLEAQIGELVGPVTVMKLHHHGVPDATTSEFLWKMRPEAILVSGSDPKQPCPVTLRRLADPQLPCAHKIYVTTDRAIEGNGKALWKSSVEGVGHIMVRVSDGGRHYQIFVMDAHDEKYRVIKATDLLPVWPAPQLRPDTPLAVSEDFGGIAPQADSVFRAVSAYASTDEIHSMIILKDGKKIYERYDTGHNADERHVMWSASKTFTALAVGFAIQDGLFNVNDKVISFFREDELPAEKSEWLSEMTVEHLLTMSSGLGTDGINQLRSLRWQHPAKEALTTPMAFKPGSRYKYNSMNTYLLSEIIQRRTGMKLSKYLEGKFFRPLGVCNWEWEESVDGVTAGGWGLYTTTTTLAKLGQFMLQNGSWNGKQLLNPSWIKDMTTPHIYQSSATPSDDWNSGYGYQTWVCTHNAYRADGAHGQFSIVIPEKNVVIAVNAQFHKGKRNFMKMIWETIYPKL